MKNFKIFLPGLIILLLFSTSGCETVSDFFGWGFSDEKMPTVIDNPTVADNNDNDLNDMPEEWSEPGEKIVSENEWKPIPGISLPPIYFSYDKENIGTSEKRKLDQVANYLNSNPEIGLIIEGNCDERGSLEYNRSLGERRAIAVKDYLVSSGIATERLRTISYGEEKPVATGTGEAVFSKNRRADLVVAKIK